MVLPPSRVADPDPAGAFPVGPAPPPAPVPDPLPAARAERSPPPASRAWGWAEGGGAVAAVGGDPPATKSSPRGMGRRMEKVEAAATMPIAATADITTTTGALNRGSRPGSARLIYLL